MKCLQTTSGRDVILVNSTEFTYGRQGNGKTPNPSPGLYGKWQVKAPRPCASPTGVSPPTGAMINQTMLTEMRHASICSKNTVTPGTTNRATTDTASSARTTEFQSGGLD